MRFVEVKTPEQQGLGMVFRLRDLLVWSASERKQSMPCAGITPSSGLSSARGERTSTNCGRPWTGTGMTKRRIFLPRRNRWLSFVLSRSMVCLDVSQNSMHRSRRPAGGRGSPRGYRRCQASVPSPRWRWRLSRRRWRLSGRGAIFRPGWASSRDNTRAVASRDSDAQANPVSVIYGAC